MTLVSVSRHQLPVRSFVDIVQPRARLPLDSDVVLAVVLPATRAVAGGPDRPHAAPVALLLGIEPSL